MNTSSLMMDFDESSKVPEAYLVIDKFFGLDLRLELMLLYGSLLRPPESCIISCSMHTFTGLVCDWSMHSIFLNIDYGTVRCGMVSEDSFRHQRLCRQGERPKFVVDPCCLELCDCKVGCYSFLLLESLAYEVYVLMLMHFRGLQVMAPLAHGSFITFYSIEGAALVQHLQHWSHLFSLNKQQVGAAIDFFLLKYNKTFSGFKDSMSCLVVLFTVAESFFGFYDSHIWRHVVCDDLVYILDTRHGLQELDRLIQEMEIKSVGLNSTSLRSFSELQEDFYTDFSLLEVDLSLFLSLCAHVLHPLCYFARMLLMHMTVFKLLLGQVAMAIVSTSSPQFVILHCCHMLLQKLVKFEKMSFIIYLGQSHIHSALRHWNMVIFDVAYGLLLRQQNLHVGCFLAYLFLIRNQAFYCLCHVCDCEVLHCSLDPCDFLLRQRWWMSKKKLVLVDDQVLSKRLSRDYVSNKQNIVAHSGWFKFILDLLYCSLPRPPEVLCDSL